MLCELLAHIELQGHDRERLRLRISTIESQNARLRSEREEMMLSHRACIDKLRKLLTRAAESANAWRNRYVENVSRN